MSDLTPAQRRSLRARAHRLHPVIIIGEAGLTPEVLKEIDRALTSHELIKIRVLNEDRVQRSAWIEEIGRASGAAPVQHIGKTLVVYRPRPDEAETPGPQQPAIPRKRNRKPKRRAKRSYQMQ